jgi:hypothetical protein
MPDLPTITAKDKDGKPISVDGTVLVNGSPVKVLQVICTERNKLDKGAPDDPSNVFQLLIEQDGEQRRVKAETVSVVG